jgi:signal transduction histidine kinase
MAAPRFDQLAHSLAEERRSLTWALPVPIAENLLNLTPADRARPLPSLKVKPVHLPWIDVNAPTPDRQQIAKLLAASRGKDECLAMVAHELRNSLAPLTTAADVLNTPGVSFSNAEVARGIITRQLANMTRLVNDLVDGARITQGKMDLRLTPTDLTVVLQQAVDDVAQSVGLRDQVVTVLLSTEPSCVLGDSTRLEQAFGNLLNNASKFSRRGGRIWVSVERSQAADGTSEAVVHVRDEGIGITAEMLPHVFDLFKQAGPSPHHAKGLGVGLALVRRIVELHGGAVTLRSAGLDRGSEFIVSLPLLPDAPLTS